MRVLPKYTGCFRVEVIKAEGDSAFYILFKQYSYTGRISYDPAFPASR